MPADQGNRRNAHPGWALGLWRDVDSLLGGKWGGATRPAEEAANPP
jgi:hypothetical protein